jgi:hypothetical protein
VESVSEDNGFPVPKPYKLLPAGTQCSVCKGSGGSRPDNHDQGCPACGGSGEEPVTQKYEMCGICQHYEVHAQGKDSQYARTTRDQPGLKAWQQCGLDGKKIENNSPACKKFDLKKKAKEGEQRWNV